MKRLPEEVPPMYTEKDPLAFEGPPEENEDEDEDEDKDEDVDVSPKRVEANKILGHLEFLTMMMLK